MNYYQLKKATVLRRVACLLLILFSTCIYSQTNSKNFFKFNILQKSVVSLVNKRCVPCGLEGLGQQLMNKRCVPCGLEGLGQQLMNQPSRVYE